jgi:hypothetical protein
MALVLQTSNDRVIFQIDHFNNDDILDYLDRSFHFI